MDEQPRRGGPSWRKGLTLRTLAHAKELRAQRARIAASLVHMP
ncbi:MAG: hypothetical protein NTU91_17230 [Chloroflexi bacterium]|nr:hypothetical protein [Chloroflexota bacterium]